jgi:hypothetical protein
MCAYVALTNASGKKDVDLILKKAGDEQEIFKLGGAVEFDNPTQVIELIFNLLNCIFEEEGTYVFEVYVSGEYIFESRFNVRMDK